MSSFCPNPKRNGQFTEDLQTVLAELRLQEAADVCVKVVGVRDGRRGPEVPRRNPRWSVREVEAKEASPVDTPPDSPSSQRSDPQCDRRGSRAERKAFVGRGKRDSEAQKVQNPTPDQVQNPTA